MPKPDIYLSVIVPAYNEAEKLPKTLKRFQEYLFQQAYSYEIIVVNDGARDNATDISHFDKMRPFFDKGFDAVICSRDPKDALGAKQAVAQAWWKRALGNMGNLYIQWMAVPGIWDTQCGFKAFRDYAAEKIFSATKINRWAFDVEVLALAKRFGYKIGIIPANWVNDPRSSVKFMAYFHTLWEVFKIRRLLNKLKI